MSGWIGVDLDGTLAHYDVWRGADHIGEPIPAMVERVKAWLAKGTEVRIFTARVGIGGGYSLESKSFDDGEFAAEQEKLIGDWCERHIGVRLKVTAHKDFNMQELWDDRCVQVIPNTGEPVTGTGEGA